MFESVKIPKKLASSPINEVIFEIRYNGNYPEEALYGMLFDVFEPFPNKSTAEFPMMQIPKMIRDNDPNLRYQALYRVANDKFAFSIGPHSIVFSALKPYPGWVAWSQFFNPILETIKSKSIIKDVERTGLRYFNILEGNIFDHINASLFLNESPVTASPSSFYTVFEQNGIYTILNVGNNAIINGNQTHDSLIDVDCIHRFECAAETFFSTYQAVLEKTHQVNEQVFFGLLKAELLNTFGPEY
ncbi:MAG: TIGR04255 family protein [Tannerella sp.]|jgi:uncharacterized protein (TIGR04255 family)|nr:TIGR04255 family protein [Tannerella sp.]